MSPSPSGSLLEGSVLQPGAVAAAANNRVVDVGHFSVL